MEEMMAIEETEKICNLIEEIRREKRKKKKNFKRANRIK